MKVLIVEGELLIAMHLEMAVAEFGHDVCGIAASALEMAEILLASRIVADKRRPTIP